MLIHEPARAIEVRRETEVLVCGGGPAGVAAAISAARAGASVQLIESAGCLGGIWTAGLMAHVIDGKNKTGLLAEILSELRYRGEAGPRNDYAPEGVKLLLEELCLAAGVHVRLHTRVVGAVVREGRIEGVLTESKSGREAWKAAVYLDCTGDGDLGAQAGCSYDIGRPENGECQPMSLCALVSGITLEGVCECVIGCSDDHAAPKMALLALLQQNGVDPSYGQPSLFQIHDNLFALMANHEYGVRADDADAISSATLRARAEVGRIVKALRASGPAWQSVRLVATAEHIGVREGRRLKGLTTISRDDLAAGRQFEDGVCTCTFCVDIHSTNPATGKCLGTEGCTVQPYQIPLRAMISADIENLMMAGRCISGDFHAHGSYRVTGNAVPMGEAAGRVAAEASRNDLSPARLDGPRVLAAL